MTQAAGRRDVQGILLLDKPAGMSSNAALQQVKRLFRAQKAGHTGNLDVPANGLLPICFGEATKITPYLLNANKRYRSRFRFGVRTTTGDAAGEIIEQQPVPALDPREVDEVLMRFTGVIEQIPPMHSALKYQGQRLYRLAVRGLTVERAPRPVSVFELRRTNLAPDELEVEVHCSKGTYIRALAEDVGSALGTCAHVLALRRTGVEPFDIGEAWSLEHLERLAAQGLAALDATLKPMDSALGHLVAVSLSDTTAYYLRSGQPVRTSGAPRQGIVRMYDPQQRFLGIGEALADGRIAPRRLINFT
ncbi:MAG: tRNA pseudouridine(55) synthase TruB [Chromatiales bacterium]